MHAWLHYVAEVPDKGFHQCEAQNTQNFPPPLKLSVWWSGQMKATPELKLSTQMVCVCWSLTAEKLSELIGWKLNSDINVKCVICVEVALITVRL